MALDKMKKASRGGGGPKLPTENVAVQIIEYNIAEKGKSNPGKDYVTGVLLANALGMTAEFDEKGTPLTEVKVKLKPSDFENRREIAELPRNVGTQKKVLPGGVVEFQGCRIDHASGMVEANWMKPLVHNPGNPDAKDPKDKPTEHAYAGMLGTVYPVNQFGKQEALLVVPAAAAAFSGEEEFRQLAEEMCQPVGPGNPGFILSAYNTALAPEDEDSHWVMQVGLRTKKIGEDEFRLETLDEALERMTTEPEGASQHVKERVKYAQMFLDAMKAPGEGEIWELIPASRVRIGSMTAQNALAQKDADRKDRRKVDPSIVFELLQGHKRDGTPYYGTFLAPANWALRRNEENDTWSVVYANTTKAFVNDTSFYKVKEIVTPNTPPEFAAHYEATAAKRAEESKAKKPENAAPAAEGGEPDYDAEAGAPAP